MPINNILELSRQGMAAQEQAIEVTSNNIANANTENYSRQKAILASGSSAAINDNINASGVKFKGAERVHDIFVENRLLQESPLLGGARARSEVLSELESILVPSSGHLGDSINNFFNAVREYSLNPEILANKANVVEAAKSTAEKFRSVYNSMSDLRTSIDRKIEMEVERVNFLAKEIASLNYVIGTSRHRESLNELQDKRDALLRELSEKIGVQTLNSNNDIRNVLVEGGAILVNGSEPCELVAIRTADSESTRVFLKGNTNELPLKEGSLGSLICVRDELVDRSIASLNKLAYEFSNKVNEIHKKGVGADGVSERPLFIEPKDINNAAYFIDVEEKIKKEPSLLTSGYSAIGDNRVALELSELQYAKNFSINSTDKNEETLNDAINHLINGVAVESNNSTQLLGQEEAVIEQLKNYREKISGVSLDEEAINLMRFQTVYNASQKAMRVGNDLFETLLKIVD